MNYKKLLRERLKLYLEAEAAILKGQSYSIGDRSLTRANLKEVQAEITDLVEAISAEELKRGRSRRVVFVG